MKHRLNIIFKPEGYLMKIILFFIFYCILLMPSTRDCYSQSITWQRLYDIPGGNDSYSYATCLADSGNFYSAGNAFINHDYRPYLMKLNPYGDTIWTRTIDTLIIFDCALASTGDGGCVLTVKENLVMRFSSTGSILWVKYSSPNTGLYDIIKTSDGGFFACGEFYDINNSTSNGYIIKLDSNGNLQWERTFLSSYVKIFYSCLELNTNGYAITGVNIDFLGDPWEVLLLRINNNGDVILQNKYTAFNRPVSGRVINKSNAVFVIGGVTTDSNWSYDNTFMMRIDTSGNFLNAKNYEANRYEEFYDMKVLAPNSYIFTKAQPNGIVNGEESSVMILDSNGEIRTEKIFRLEKSATFRSILLLNNGDFVFAGDGRRTPPNPYKTFIVRTDSLLYAPPIGILSNNEIMPTDFVLLQNYPNPFNPTTKINFRIKKKAFVQIVIFDLLGRVCRKINKGSLMPGEYSVIFDAEGFASGVYFYSMLVDERITETKKMILVH